MTIRPRKIPKPIKPIVKAAGRRKKDTAFFSLSIPIALADKLKKIAEAEGRSRNGQITWMLQEAIRSGEASIDTPAISKE